MELPVGTDGVSAPAASGLAAWYQRPQVRDVRQRGVPLGSYESLQRASLMEEAVWNKVMHGLTTCGYSTIVRELKEFTGLRSQP